MVKKIQNKNKSQKPILFLDMDGTLTDQFSVLRSLNANKDIYGISENITVDTYLKQFKGDLATVINQLFDNYSNDVGIFHDYDRVRNGVPEVVKEIYNLGLFEKIIILSKRPASLLHHTMTQIEDFREYIDDVMLVQDIDKHERIKMWVDANNIYNENFKCILVDDFHVFINKAMESGLNIKTVQVMNRINKVAVWANKYIDSIYELPKTLKYVVKHWKKV